MKKKNIFKWSFIAFSAVMVIMIIASVLGMRGLLNEYEADQPEYQAKNAIKQLASDASDADAFWSKYSLPEIEAGVYEKGNDVKAEFLSLFDKDELSYAIKNGSYGEDEMRYLIRNGSMDLAEVTLKAEGDIKTKLFVFTSREWHIENIQPIFEKNEYTVQLPDYFTLSANGIEISKDEGVGTDNGKIKYTVSGVYIEPEFSIGDGKGNEVSYIIKNNKVLPEYYDYTLVIPHTLKVEVNGEESEGTKREDGLVLHKLVFLEKPEVTVSDLFGNTVDYEGKSLPLTYMSIIAPETYSVKCNGGEIPKSAIETSVYEEFEIVADIVNGVPDQCKYTVAILNLDAEISVTDDNGDAVELQKGSKIQNLMAANRLEDVPAEVSKKIDVLKTAQNWSLFMSNDYSYNNISKLLLPNSKQYKVAKDYANSIDKTFTSKHTLKDPAFTECDVSNFTWITDDCFSVEIRFVKHMLLTRTGKTVDDPMNDRFYFVNKDNKWYLAGMKEVAENG